MKLCTDCKHHSNEKGIDYCGAFIDPVNGRPGAFADVERRGAGLTTGCGADGKRWEPKPQEVSFFRKLFVLTFGV